MLMHSDPPIGDQTHILCERWARWVSHTAGCVVCVLGVHIETATRKRSNFFIPIIYHTLHKDAVFWGTVAQRKQIQRKDITLAEGSSWDGSRPCRGSTLGI